MGRFTRGAVPGGAPMNVAYHLKKLGNNPALITRVGLDDWGKRLITLMEKNKIYTGYFQRDNELETGKVNATVNENKEVSYEIIKPVAWDNIQWDSGFEELLSNTPYLVFGSLISRSEVSRNTLYKLLEIARLKVLDINLRPPHYTRKIIEELLFQDINILKLNLSELELIAGWFADYSNEKDQIKIVHQKFNIPNIIVTRGGKGAVFYSEGRFYEHAGYPVKVADTVGSGDSFLAAFLSKLHEGKSKEEALQYASALGALIASYNGACPDYDPAEIDDMINGKAPQHKKMSDTNQ